ERVWLSDGAVGVEKAGPEVIERRAPLEDQVVAVLDLREEQAMSTASGVALPRGKERGETGEPLLPHSAPCRARSTSRRVVAAVPGLGSAGTHCHIAGRRCPRRGAAWPASGAGSGTPPRRKENAGRPARTSGPRRRR